MHVYVYVYVCVYVVRNILLQFLIMSAVTLFCNHSGDRRVLVAVVKLCSELLSIPTFPCNIGNTKFTKKCLG